MQVITSQAVLKNVGTNCSITIHSLLIFQMNVAESEISQLRKQIDEADKSMKKKEQVI